MAKLTLAEQNWYRDNLTLLANSARQYTENRVAQLIEQQLNNGDVNVAQLRNDTIDEVSAVTKVYGESAKALSNEFFDYVMEKEGSDITAITFPNDYDEEWIEEQVRYMAGLITEEEFEQYARDTGRYSEYLIRRSSFINLYNNAKYHKVRFGRIPVGLKTCEFCLMLASRGFVYYTEESAGGDWNAYHDNCDCVIVPSTDGTLDVEGYDLGLYEDIYSSARKRAIAELGDSVSAEELYKEILRQIRQLKKV